MSINTEQVEADFEEIVANIPLNCPFPLFATDEVKVIYGLDDLEAILDIDYTVELNTDDYSDFTITPLPFFLDKLEDLMEEDPDEINAITVKRELDYLTNSQPGLAGQTSFLSRELERIAMRFQQIAFRVDAIQDPGAAIQQAIDAAEAAAASASSLVGTSASSVAVGVGVKTFITQSGKLFNGQYVFVSSASDPTNFMSGPASYANSTLNVNVPVGGANGVGTHDDWVISVSGPQGVQGEDGPAGAGSGDMLKSENLAGLADYVAARVNMGVRIGVDVQAYHSMLALLTSLTAAANKGIYFVDGVTVGTYDLTAAGRALLAGVNVAAQLVTLGIGTAGLLDVGTTANKVVQLTAAAKLPAVDGSLLTNLPVDGVLIHSGAIVGGAQNEDFNWTAGAYRRIEIEIRDLSHSGSSGVTPDALLRLKNNGSVLSGANYKNVWEQGTVAAVANGPTGGTHVTSSWEIASAAGLKNGNGTGYSAKISIDNLASIPIIRATIYDIVTGDMIKMVGAYTSAVSQISGISILASVGTRVLSSTTKVLIKGYT